MLLHKNLEKACAQILSQQVYWDPTSTMMIYDGVCRPRSHRQQEAGNTTTGIESCKEGYKRCVRVFQRLRCPEVRDEYPALFGETWGKAREKEGRAPEQGNLQAMRHSSFGGHGLALLPAGSRSNSTVGKERLRSCNLQVLSMNPLEPPTSRKDQG